MRGPDGDYEADWFAVLHPLRIAVAESAGSESASTMSEREKSYARQVWETVIVTGILGGAIAMCEYLTMLSGCQ